MKIVIELQEGITKIEAEELLKELKEEYAEEFPEMEEFRIEED